MHGDTFLKRVDARFGRTRVIARRKRSGLEGTTRVRKHCCGLSARQARIEDLLGLFVTNKRAHVRSSRGDDASSDSLRRRILPQKGQLHASFGINDGSFTDAQTQQNVNELSEGARGNKMDDTESALTDLGGQVQLTRGVAQFTDLRFGIPGARARMQGTYNILNYKIDLHGRMRVDTKISKTETGFKSLMLKMMDPIFKKKKKGEVVPVHITGTYEKPQFGLDLDPSPG